MRNGEWKLCVRVRHQREGGRCGRFRIKLNAGCRMRLDQETVRSGGGGRGGGHSVERFAQLRKTTKAPNYTETAERGRKPAHDPTNVGQRNGLSDGLSVCTTRQRKTRTAAPKRAPGRCVGRVGRGQASVRQLGRRACPVVKVLAGRVATTQERERGGSQRKCGPRKNRREQPREA